MVLRYAYIDILGIADVVFIQFFRIQNVDGVRHVLQYKKIPLRGFKACGKGREYIELFC